ncbi:putative glycosyltransferase EpsJ [Roseibium album]|nr:putative glycosyltransferase EpsJ [Roseibium album]
MKSVLAQHLSHSGDLEVLVVDNTADRDAQGWIMALQGQDPRIRYIHAAEPGISHARNIGILNANGDFLAFLDDDETAAPDWLSSLHQALETHGADIGTGPVHPVFEDKDTLDWDPTPFFYGAREELPTGAHRDSARTGNILFRVSTCFNGTPPFNPSFGKSGGEDTELTHRLFLAGRKIIWVTDANVQEFWPAEKSSLSAFLRRKRVTARNTTRARIGASPKKLPAIVALVAKSLVQLAIFALPALGTYSFDRQRFAACALHLNSALGKLTYWYRTDYYQANHETQS